MNQTILYKFTAPHGKCYIGVTKQPLQDRLAVHFRAKTVIGAALRKYGLETFTIETLVVGEKDYVYELEKKAIVRFETLTPLGYNIAEGGEGGGGKRTQETKKRISVALTGRSLSPSHRVKISEAIQGNVASEETCRKIGDVHRGKTVSEEVRKRMSEAHIGNRHSEETRNRMSESQKARRVKEERI